VGLPRHGSPEAPVHTHVGARYVERGYDETGMPNAVTAVLLNYRAFDTFLEVVVIFTALLGVLALSAGASAGRGDGPPARAPAAGCRGTGAVPGTERAAAADHIPVSPVVSFVVRLLAPLIATFAVATLYGGHVSPGGGFQSAAVAGALFIAVALVLGNARASQLVPMRGRTLLQAAAPLSFALVALLGWRLTGAFLGYPADAAGAGLREAMVLTVEIGIAVGGGVILARLFLSMEG
jgi:multicomponent Na+:H+ antiporter subunit B